MNVKINDISIELNVHLPENPASTGHGASVDLNLLNAKHLKISDWTKGNQPSFTLTITNPLSIGLDSSEQSNVSQFLDDLILALNIVLKRTTFSKHASSSKKSKINFQVPKPTSEVRYTPTGKEVILTEHIHIRDEVSISIGVHDELDEPIVLELLQKIKKIRLNMANSSLNVNNFQKSLNEYDAAMEGIERLSVFKHLFSSLELATNCDNAQDRTGHSLDSEVVRISGINVTDMEWFRNFNSRTKHKDRNPADEQLYQEGLSQLGGKINSLRNTSQKIIQTRFNYIS
jgi:hypothetical protein